MKTVLVTGGLGYIGSHTVVELLNDDYNVVIIDDLSNSHLFMLDKIEEITGKRPSFYKVDLKNKRDTENIFQLEKIDAVIHFAAFKAVGESVEQPLKYYKNNLLSLIHLIEVMEQNNVNDLVFSSSATVYGLPDELPVTEKTPLKKATNPYGNTKSINEDMIRDYAKVTDSFRGIILRYFNPVGAHDSYLIGELPEGIPNNLMPFITQTAAGERDFLTVFGDDYDTEDGTAIRDYIHVVDLAKAHIAALQFMDQLTDEENVETFNVGTGQGYSVLEMIKNFEQQNDLQLNYKIGERRAGDVPVIFANTESVNKKLNWKAEKTLGDMVKSSWEFQKQIKKKK